MPELFGPRPFSLLELFGRSQNVGKLAGIRPEPNGKPVFGAALIITAEVDDLFIVKLNLLTTTTRQ